MSHKSLILICLVFIFSCTSKDKDIIESPNYFFETYQKDSSFKQYICEGDHFSKKDIALTNLKRKNIDLQDITSGTDGFEFGFCFSSADTISYYLVFGEKNKVNFSKLYRIIYNRNEIEKGQYPTDSFEVKPKSGWSHFLNELYKMKTHQILNEMDTSLPGITRNFTGVLPYVIVEFSNKNIYRMYQWSRVLLNLKDEQNILIDKVIKLLYEEFKLKKYMPLLWENVKEEKVGI